MNRHTQRILIETNSGNRYLIGDNIILNENERKGFSISSLKNDEIPKIVVGEPWGIPGSFQTTSVKRVFVLTLNSPSEETPPEEQLKEPNPFNQLEDMLDKLTDKFDIEQ